MYTFVYFGVMYNSMFLRIFIVRFMSKKSFVWDYFNAKNKDFAVCSKCKCLIATKGGSTKGMKTHLKAKHGIEEPNPPYISDESQSKHEEIPTKKTKITHFFSTSEDNSVHAVIARLTAKDLLPFSVLSTSLDLRMAMHCWNVDIPKSPNTIRQYMLAYAEKLQTDISGMLNSKKESGERFSCSLDEWTSSSSKRFLNLNIHTSNHETYNLGLIRITGSATAEVCLDLIKIRLNKFGLNIDKDIVCFTTDGAAVMIKLMRIASCEHQLCYAHAIHLSVCDVLYKRTQYSVDSETEHSVEEIDSEEEVENCGETLAFVNDPPAVSYQSSNIHNCIEKVRNIVRSVKRSPLKNDQLQKYVVEETGSEKCLLLDVKVRWNSLLLMISRFLEVIKPIKKAMLDWNIVYEVSERDIDMMKSLISALEPLDLVIKKLSDRTTNLLTAHAAINFAISELKSTNSSISQELASSLENRILSRSRTDLLQTLKFLKTHPTQHQATTAIEMNTIKYTLASLAERLHFLPTSVDETQIVPPVNTTPAATTSLAERLEFALQGDNDNILHASPLSIESLIQKEMDYYRATGEKGFLLDKLFCALSSIAPSSVEAERAFSASGLFCTKIRSRLSDNTLDCLCFLRHHFLK